MGGWQQAGPAGDAGRGAGRVRLALHLAQAGSKHDQAKPLRRQGLAAVLEVVEDWRGDTYRAVCTVKSSAAVYVLHCFQKKATKGISTPKPDLDLIAARLKAAEAHAKEQAP